VTVMRFDVFGALKKIR